MNELNDDRILSDAGQTRRIDYHSPVPYYHQLADILRAEIEEGKWRAEELLPSEGSLIQLFGVSRSVTRKALELLEGEGRVLRIKGKGTIVVRPKMAYAGVEAAGRWFARPPRSLQVGDILRAGRVPAGGNLGRLFGLAPRQEVWEIVFTHVVDGEPVSLTEMYLLVLGTLTVSAPPEFDEGGPDMFRQLATKYGVDIVHSEVDMEATEASELEAEILSVEPGSALVQINSLDSTTQRTAGFTRTVIRPDHFYFAVSLHRKRGAPTTSPLSAAYDRRED